METYSMFEPKSKRRLSIDYPELKENQHIAELSARDQKFCWYLGCEVSPLFKAYNGDDKQEHEKAIDTAIAECYSKSDGSKIKDIKRKIPANLLRGIEEFEKYNISVRVRSKKLLSTIADNLEKIIDVDVDSEQFYEVDKDGSATGRKDFDALKKYVDMSLAISKNINDIVHQAESGYSITLVEEEDEKVVSDGISIVDYYHEKDK